MDEDDLILELHKPLVNFIAEIVGDNCEVLMHDLRKSDNSIIAIANNHITGREIGGTVTDFASQIVNSPENYKDTAYVANYPGKIVGKPNKLRSSTYFIRNLGGQIIGVLCTNVDVTQYENARKILDHLIMDNREEKAENPKEIFSENVDDLIARQVEFEITKTNVEPTRMSTDEKKKIVHNINKKGLFSLKGAVTIIAKMLKVSEQTIYRYVKELSK